jgi:two-component system LytT family sensor kinase
MVSSTVPVTIADEGLRHRRTTRLLFAVVWLVPAVLAAVQMSVVGDASGTHYDIGSALQWQGASWMMWGLWSQVVLTLVARVKLDTSRLLPWLAAHIGVNIVISAVNVLAIAWLDHVYGAVGQVTSYAVAVRVVLVNHLDFQVVLYWAVVGAAYMVEYVRRYRARDRDATELEQKLAFTQLEALRMQLNPHFLFNALNSVAELMEMDVREAQRTLTRVADLLRLSLRSAGSSLIPVWQEIELVELYLQIARVRYGQGLAADITVDPSAVDEMLPSFLLQPLVENALKHGLAPGHRDQCIEVRIGRSAHALEIVVEDNGKGLDGLLTTSGRFRAATPSVDGLGIGLTNTRMRLTMLYGDRYAFRMSNQPTGGCRVEIRIPIHDRPHPIP